MVQNVRYLNGPQIPVTLPFEYWTPILSGIQMFGIQMFSVYNSVVYHVNRKYLLATQEQYKYQSIL